MNFKNSIFNNLLEGNKHDQVRLVLFLLLMISLPFTMKISNGLILLSVAYSLVFFFLQHRKAITLNSLTVSLLLYFFLEVLSLLNTENLKEGISILETHLAFLFVPLAFANFEISEKRRNQFFFAFATGCFLASLICVLVNIQLSLVEGKLFHEYYFSHDRVSDPIGMQAVYFALYLSLSILGILNFLKNKFTGLSINVKILLSLIVLYFLALIIASGARTIIIALMLIVVFNIVVHSLQKKSYKFLILSALIPFIFLLLILLNPVVSTRFADLRHTKAEDSNYDSYFARTNIWNPGIEAIQENLWFGVGPGDQQAELYKKFEKYNYSAGIEAKFNLHNQYLQTTLGLGAIGLLGFLSILVVQLVKAIRERDFLYLSFLMLFSIECLTESMLIRNKGIVFFLIFSFFFFKSSNSISKNHA